tara:strand:- start:206 stop:346 length:141 start_codon:yes stop_codon:yes gene_type:complete
MRSLKSRFSMGLLTIGLATGAILLAGGNDLGMYIILCLLLFIPSPR